MARSEEPLPSIPELVELGVVGVSGPGESFAVVESLDSELPFGEPVVFCEGFAEDAQGRGYAWEVWTVDEFEWTVAMLEDAAAVDASRHEREAGTADAASEATSSLPRR